MIEQKAQLNYLHMAPRKVRLVADLIKGMPVTTAEAHLLLRETRAAKPILKLLRSAIANAKNNKMNTQALYVKSIRVDQGPMMRRHLPRARGSATLIQKKMSHITLALAEGEAAKDPFVILQKKKALKKHTHAAPSKKTPKKPVEKEKASTPTERTGGIKKFFRRKSV